MEAHSWSKCSFFEILNKKCIASQNIYYCLPLIYLASCLQFQDNFMSKVSDRRFVSRLSYSQTIVTTYTYRKNIYLELMLVLLWTKTDDILQQPGVSLGTSTTWPYNCSTGIFRVQENLLVTHPVNFEIVKFKPNALNYVKARVQILSLHIPSHTKPIKKASSRK